MVPTEEQVRRVHELLLKEDATAGTDANLIFERFSSLDAARQLALAAEQPGLCTFMNKFFLFMNVQRPGAFFS